MPQKTLYRSLQNKQVSGVVAGLAEYLDTDVNILRLLALVLILMSGIVPGLIVYFVAAALIPVGPDVAPPKDL